MTANELTGWDKRRARRVREIREHALSLVVEAGVEAFSMHKLAERLNLSTGALYRYYSRDELLAAVEVDVIEIFDAFFERLDAVSGEGVQKIVTFCDGYQALAGLKPEPFKLLSRFLSTPDPLIADEAAGVVLGPSLSLLLRFAAGFHEAEEAGELAAGESLMRAALTWSSLQGVIDRKKLTRLAPEEFRVDAMVDELLAALLRGWGADADQVQRVLAERPKIDFENLVEEG